MSTISRLFLPAALVAAFVSPSLAADYDPPIIIEDAPEVVPVEVGSGWYLRGDVGYTVSDGSDNGGGGFFGIDEDHTSVFGGGGVGYHFTDYFRADITGAFLQQEEATLDLGGLRGSIKSTMSYGMATGYVDLGTVVGITPYIGAGAGFIYSHNTNSGDVALADFPGAYPDDDFAFAYTLNAGFAYRMSQNLSLDVGYQYLNSPDAKHFSASGDTYVDEGFDMHQIKVGLRYDLW
ncbi:porin family protein [Tianweitania sp. BSSL-BM11]|uniref:Porin family protein n=1 Tax=Tianweitania aestuarii TaxID=2814886 RepID=A0ABS5RZT8_9HYPH|nr:outer membrane beta-barrel protein [Tianweitania aestuarii]MBS9722560.1 porin family protein [Tianweitania aestuarii]